ncbi:MAG: YceD family protein [Anaerolineales bacterium]
MTKSHSESHYISPRVLKINVGFLLAEGAGFHRDLPLDVPERLKISDDLIAERLQGVLRLTRTSEGILVQGTLDFAQREACNRCLTEFVAHYPLHIEELFATPPHEHSSEFTVKESNILDLAPLLRAEAMVSHPQQLFCQPDCLGLCPTCGKNLNDGPCDCPDDNIDPRWAALLALQNETPDDE